MKKDSNFYAHSLKGQPPEKWQPLEEHLKNVAEQAASFASEFGGEKWAYLAGLLKQDFNLKGSDLWDLMR